jgi:hypothetical protein
MAIIVICRACMARVRLGDDRAGELLECPRPDCDAIITVPPPPPDEDDEEVSLRDFKLLGFVLLLVLAVFIALLSVRAFLRASLNVQVGIVIAAVSLAMLAITATVVSEVRKCRWLVGLAYTLVGASPIALFAMADRDLRLVIFAIAFLLGWLSLVVGVISSAERCSLSEGVGHTLAGLATIIVGVGKVLGEILLVLVVGFLLSGGSHGQGHRGRVVSCRRCGTVIDASSPWYMHHCPVCGRLMT